MIANKTKFNVFTYIQQVDNSLIVYNNLVYSDIYN